MRSEAKHPPLTNRGVVTESNEQLTASIDWVQVTFKNTPFYQILDNVLMFPKDFMTHEPHGRFRYAGKYIFGGIELLLPPDDYQAMGHHLYLTGQACREMEIYLQAQRRTWIDFFDVCLEYGGKFTRLDIAIDDRKTYFDIEALNEKIREDELISRFRKWAYFDSGEISGERAGRTINFGSRESDVFVVFYEKNYEQAAKQNFSVEELGPWNRYEIRLRQDVATRCVQKLIDEQNLEHIAKSVLNNHLRFVVRKGTEKQRDLWPIWQPWADLIQDSEKLRLSMSPAPRSLEQKRQWIQSYVAPTLKMLKQADDNLGESTLEDIINGAVLKPKHESILVDFLAQVQMQQMERERVQKEGCWIECVDSATPFI